MTETSEYKTQHNAHEFEKSSLDSEILKSWMIKAHPHPTLPLDILMGLVSLMPISLLIYSYLGEFINGVEIFLRITGWIGLLMAAFLWIRGARQKTVYKYRITIQGGELEYWDDYPEGFGEFFKWLSGVSLFVVICLIVIDPVFVWMLAGPGGMAIAGAGHFMTWKNKKKYKWFIWDDYEHVIIDRKRSVVVFLDHPLVFEAFLEKRHVDSFISLIRPYMPPHTKYVEECWKD